MEEAFYSPEFGMGSLPKFLKYLDAKKIPYDKQSVKTFYQKQPVVQRLRLRKERKTFNPIYTNSGPRSILYMDSMFFFYKKQKIGVITAMDLFSRKGYLYIKKLYRQNKDKGTGMTVKDAETFLDALGFLPQEIRTDQGSEFKFKLKKYKDTHKPMLDWSHKLLSPIERFNYTIRLKWEKTQETNPSLDYYGILQNIVQAYNNTHHDYVGMTPNEADLDENYERVLRNVYMKRNKIYKKDVLKKGTKVRLYKKRDALNKKIRPFWTKEIYTIDKYDPELKRYTFPGTNNLYDIDDLLPVHPDTPEEVQPEPEQQETARERRRRLANPVPRGENMRRRRAPRRLQD